MKAIRVHEFGEPSVMKLEDVPDPVAGAGEVVLRVHAVGINPVDTYIRAGRYASKPPLPYTPGSDAAGVVESVGDGVFSVAVGDRVFTAGLTKAAYAERVLVKAEQVRRLPASVSFAQGAAINVPYATAYRALLQKARAQSGEVVMIHGASGGVGLATLQIARAHGLTIVATAGTPEGLRLLEEQGAKYVLNHHDPDYISDAIGATCGQGIDVIIEMLANVNLNKDLELLAPHGRVVVIGSRGEVAIEPRLAMSKDASIHGLMLFNASAQELQEAFDYIEQALAEGALAPVVGKEFPLGEAPRAHEAVMQPGAYGKIVLTAI